MASAKVCIFIQYWMYLQGRQQEILNRSRQGTGRFEVQHVACVLNYYARAARKRERSGIIEFTSKMAVTADDHQHFSGNGPPTGLCLCAAVQDRVRQFVARIGSQPNDAIGS
jgi:hypothetical protein